MLNALLELLSGAGTVLDTPGSIARGLISGQPGRALGGIFDPSQRVYGEEMTGDPWSGMAVDMLADPMNLVGGLGAFKAAKGLGARRALQSELANAQKVQDAVQGAMRSHVAPPPGTMGSIDTLADINRTYNPELMSALPDTPHAKMYKRVHPDLAAHIDEMGLGYRLPQEGFQGASQMVVNMDPEAFNQIARVRGGHAKLAGDPRNSLMRHQEMMTDINPPHWGGSGMYEGPRGMPAFGTLPGADDLAGHMIQTGSGPTRLGDLPLDQAVLGAGYNVADAGERLRQMGQPMLNPILAALGGHNVLRGAGHVMRGNREGLF